MAYVVARRDASRNTGPKSGPPVGPPVGPQVGPPVGLQVGPNAASAGRRVGEGVTRYEIRESVSTPAGPRARSLATFRVLTDAVIAQAAGRAQRSFDAEKIRVRAAALGAPSRQHAAAGTASALVAQLRAGEKLPPALAVQLRGLLPRPTTALPDSLESAVDWIGVDDAARGRALRDLLDVASRIPTRPRAAKLSFPRLSSTGGSSKRGS